MKWMKRCLLSSQAGGVVGQRRTVLPPGGSSLPGTPSERRCCWSGGRSWLVAGVRRLSAYVEGSVEALSEGGDVTHLPGGGATVEGEVAVPGRAQESDWCTEESHRRLPAALLQGGGAGRPAGGAAGDPRQQWVTVIDINIYIYILYFYIFPKPNLNWKLKIISPKNKISTSKNQNNKSSFVSTRTRLPGESPVSHWPK